MTFNVPSGSGGGGGGSYTAGNGIGIAGGTITNTGTIVQPAATGSNNGAGIILATGAPGPTGNTAGNLYIYGPSFTTDYAGLANASTFNFYTGDITNTNTGVSAGAVPGAINFLSGKGIVNAATVVGASFQALSGNVYGDAGTASGGGAIIQAGYAKGSTLTNLGGNNTISAGNATGGKTASGGNLILAPGAGSGAATLNQNGVVIVTSMPTADPSIAGAFYVDPVTHIVKWK